MKQETEKEGQARGKLDSQPQEAWAVAGDDSLGPKDPEGKILSLLFTTEFLRLRTSLAPMGSTQEIITGE